MRVNSDTDVQLLMKTEAGGAGEAHASRRRSAEKGKKAFFAGNIVSTGKGSYGEKIEKRRMQAQKEIKKLIGDTWSSDKKLDSDVQELRDEASKLKADTKELREKVDGFEEQRAALKEEYGIEDGSEEQRELELLMKEHDSEGKPVDWTEEELDKLGEIHSRGLTDYQAKSLEIYKYEDPAKEEIAKNESKIEGNYSTVRATKQARLESGDPMLKTQDAAEAIAKAASKDIIGMLKDEAVDHMEEEYEKNLEEAREKAEKKEEEEELRAERKEKKEKLEEELKELTEKLADDGGSADTQKKIQEILDRLKLIDEDIKGSVVDANV